MALATSMVLRNDQSILTQGLEAKRLGGQGLGRVLFHASKPSLSQSGTTRSFS